jgi:hypothetical protein
MIPAPSETPVPELSQAEPLRGEPTGEAVPEQTPDRLPSRTIFMAVEIVLGLLALGSAVIFIYLHRKAS